MVCRKIICSLTIRLSVRLKRLTLIDSLDSLLHFIEKSALFCSHFHHALNAFPFGRGSKFTRGWVNSVRSFDFHRAMLRTVKNPSLSYRTWNAMKFDDKSNAIERTETNFEKVRRNDWYVPLQMADWFSKITTLWLCRDKFLWRFSQFLFKLVYSILS